MSICIFAYHFISITFWVNTSFCSFHEYTMICYYVTFILDSIHLSTIVILFFMLIRIVGDLAVEGWRKWWGTVTHVMASMYLGMPDLSVSCCFSLLLAFFKFYKFILAPCILLGMLHKG